MTGRIVPFDAERIRAQLNLRDGPRLRGLTLLDETDSTNRELARRPVADWHAHAVLADRQTAGRGRRQRIWHSPRGGNLYLSLGWRFEHAPESLASLPLACAVIAARSLEGAGAKAIRIKWPNDLQLGGRKVGGILVESSVAGRARFDAIAGIGINIRMGETAADGIIDQPWTDLASHLEEAREDPFRDDLAGRLIAGLLSGFECYRQVGFAPFEADWQRFDALWGNEVVVRAETGDMTGTALGITPEGALRVRVETRDAGTGITEFVAADVSVRLT